MGQVGMPRCLPWGRLVWHCCLQDSGPVAPCAVLSDTGSGDPLEWAFDGPWHPLCRPSHECPVDVAFPGRGGPAVGQVCTAVDGRSLPLTRGYAIHPKPLLRPRLVSGSVQVWQQINWGYSIHSEASGHPCYRCVLFQSYTSFLRCFEPTVLLFLSLSLWQFNAQLRPQPRDPFRVQWSSMQFFLYNLL